MNGKIKGKVQPRGKMLPGDTPLLTIRPMLLANFGLTAERGVKAKAIDELRTAIRLAQDLQPPASRDELKVNKSLAHITNAAILSVGSLEGRIWLEKICAQRGQTRKTRTSLLLLMFKAFGSYDRSEERRRQSDKCASDDARGMLHAMALEKKLPLELATNVFTVPGKGRSSFYRPKGGPNPNFPLEVSPTHRDRLSKRPAGTQGLGLFITTERGAKLSGLILDSKKVAAIVAYANKLNV